MDAVRASEEDTLYPGVQHERVSKLRRADHVPRNGRPGGKAPQTVKARVSHAKALGPAPGAFAFRRGRDAGRGRSRSRFWVRTAVADEWPRTLSGRSC